MTEITQKIKELDGKQLYHSFLAGAQRIFEQQKLLNKINVFPVADADTGTNLASTMRSIMDAIIPTDNLKQTAVAMADAALSGARGNSGIIFAQFLYGFSNELNEGQPLDIKSFAESMKKAVAYAYDAIANPVEGTILTVIKEWAEHLDKIKDRIDDFIKLLVEAYNKALEALAGTTKKLEVLAKAHVVDAGAKGFVYFLEGIKDFFTLGQPETAITAHADESAGEEVEVQHDVITFRFCTEALINGQNLDQKKIRSFLENSGDSLVVAGSRSKMRVHIHTDHPIEVMSQLHRFGEISYQKVDDMIFQNSILLDRRSDVALMTDSTCDLPREFTDRYQIHVVPLNVHFGETYYLDRLTINPEKFYDRLEQSEVSPTTSQPSAKDFQNKFEYLSTQYKNIIGIHLSSGLSGTYSNAEIAGREVAKRSSRLIEVIDSKVLTGALGLILVRAARALEEGMSHFELSARIKEWIPKAGIRVSVQTLKYIIRSGRVSPMKSFIARFLDLKPIIALDELGKAVLFSKSFTEKGCTAKVIRDFERMFRKNKIWEYAITHAANPETANYLATEMERLTGKKPLYLEHASPVLVAHAGPGIVCISYLLE
ncbi:MAG: DegV family EDD domain-containing protein [Bacteroidetes bacterium]|nr:DegV family EDD domain-containing protein [Bacteroidota bacterium]